MNRFAVNKEERVSVTYSVSLRVCSFGEKNWKNSISYFPLLECEIAQWCILDSEKSYNTFSFNTDFLLNLFNHRLSISPALI